MKNINSSGKFKINKTVVTRFTPANTRANVVGTSIVTSSIALYAA